MTATFKPGEIPNLALKNEEDRKIQYICSLLSWLDVQSIQSIVFCENSGTQFDFSKLKELADNKGKKLEVIVFNGDKKSLKYGKGYGEGHLILHAFRNSTILKNCTSFYKITGRLFVSNFETIHLTHLNDSNVFWRFKGSCSLKTLTHSNYFPNKLLLIFRSILLNYLRKKISIRHKLEMIDTRFYKCDKSFYLKTLCKKHNNVRDRWVYYLEHSFFDAISNCQEVIKKSKPTIKGMGASYLNAYDSNYSTDLVIRAQTFL
jgi:hypothetical protein